jgi:hypothetical protein
MQRGSGVEDFNCEPETRDRAKAVCHAAAVCQLPPIY